MNKTELYLRAPGLRKHMSAEFLRQIGAPVATRKDVPAGGSIWLTGSCRQLLFSPKGGVEGLLLNVKRKVVQVSFIEADGEVIARLFRPGKHLHLLAVPDRSPKTKAAAHPVFRFKTLTDASGASLPLPAVNDEPVTVTGTVAELHYARHGQPNGVVLGSGEYVHLRPEGMVQAGLTVGAKVRAVGHAGVNLFNQRWIDALQVNGIVLP